MFDENTTHVIAGGTGGLGRAIAEWMVKKRNVRNLLLLSRSGIKSDAAAKLVTELNMMGATVHAAECDICDLSALCSVIDDYKDTMPPIGGCIQASMVLRVGRYVSLVI